MSVSEIASQALSVKVYSQDSEKDGVEEIATRY
jgi:hypothetical protein